MTTLLERAAAPRRPAPTVASGELAAVRDGDVWRFDTVETVAAPPDLGETVEPADDGGLSATVAGAIPVQPPADWFEDPQLDGPTALTVTADGRVYGHAAAWGVRHIGLPGCRTAPRSTSGYRYYRTGQVECADGSMVATGRITLGTGHADLAGNLTAASEHYDNTGAAVADVACGEDAHGIWFAGALRPDVEPAQVRALRASSLSGDWRPAGHHLEMVGLLAVNVPGFPTPRAALAASGAEVYALVAAGVVLRAPLDDGEIEGDEALTAATDSSKKSEKKGGETGGSSSWDEDKHPRGTGDQGGQWVARNEGGKAAQGDKGAQKNYGVLETGDDKASAAMLKGLSDDDLRKLTAFAYSSKTSDPRIVKARNRVANEMGSRGLDIKRNGALGGGKASATRASAEPDPAMGADGALVARGHRGGGGGGDGGGGGGFRYRHGWVLLDGDDKPPDNSPGDRLVGIDDSGEQAAAARDMSDDDLFDAHKELYQARGKSAAVDGVGGVVRDEMTRRGTATRGDGVNSALDRVRDQRGEQRGKVLASMSRAQLHQVGLAAGKAGTVRPSDHAVMDDVRTSVRDELARRTPVSAAAAERNDDMTDDLLDDFEETTVSDKSVTAAGDDAESDAPAGASFSDGDRVSLGDTGLSGTVTATSGEDVTVEVTAPASMLARTEDPVAASADPTVAALQAITASLTTIKQRLDRQDAERRSERGAAILEGLPG